MSLTSRHVYRHRRKLKSEINIIPLLDILLVLLLVFIATTPSSLYSIKVELPNTRYSKMVLIDDNDNLPIILEVSGLEKYSIIINGYREESLPSEKIIAIVKKLLIKNEIQIVLIAGTKNVPYEEVIKAIDMLYQAGVKSVGLMIKPKPI